MFCCILLHVIVNLLWRGFCAPRVKYLEDFIMDFDAIKKAAQKYGPDMTRFLRDMIAIPSESCEEKGVVYRIKEEMEKLASE